MATMEPEKLVALQRAVVLRGMRHVTMVSFQCGYVDSRNPELCNCRAATNVDWLIKLAGGG